ncbi:MAG: hypothetical protein Q4B43_05585 [Bacteroidota bacterium]|nr:hypothetical protein [Bacteroidota bacterium]
MLFERNVTARAIRNARLIRLYDSRGKMYKFIDVSKRKQDYKEFLKDEMHSGRCDKVLLQDRKNKFTEITLKYADKADLDY